MKQQCCGNCKYHRDVGNPKAVACHRYPPTITEAKEQTVTAYFPLIIVEGWCGEHKPTKLHMAVSTVERAISRRNRR